MKAMSIEGWEKHFASKGLRMASEVTFERRPIDEWNEFSKTFNDPNGYSIVVYKGSQKYLVAWSNDFTGESISPSEFKPAPKVKRHYDYMPVVRKERY